MYSNAHRNFLYEYIRRVKNLLKFRRRQDSPFLYVSLTL